MSTVPTINRPSLTVPKLQMYFCDQSLACGSGFLWRRDKSVFLVTSLHNFTGRNHNTNKCLSKKAALPNNFGIQIWVNKNNETGLLESRLRLFCEFGPVFRFDRENDIAIYDLTKFLATQEVGVTCLNDCPEKDWSNYISADCFVIGYPSGIDAGNLPVWKRGTIASEPEVSVNNQNITLIDAQSFSGMSGGPVISYKSVGSTTQTDHLMIDHLAVAFHGLYAGRYCPDGEKSGQLGYFYKKEEVLALIESDKSVGEIEMPEVIDPRE